MISIKCLKKKFLEKDGITFDDWIKDERNVYIGKKVPRVQGTFNSKWLNPYELKKYDIEKSLSLYRDHVVGKLFRGIRELENKTLGCWCTDASVCHGSILIETLKKLTCNSESDEDGSEVEDSIEERIKELKLDEEDKGLEESVIEVKTNKKYDNADNMGSSTKYYRDEFISKKRLRELLDDGLVLPPDSDPRYRIWLWKTQRITFEKQIEETFNKNRKNYK